MLAKYFFPFSSDVLSLPNILSTDSGLGARESLECSDKHHLFFLGLNNRFFRDCLNAKEGWVMA